MKSLICVLFVLAENIAVGQQINIGYQDSIESEVLKETRKVFIHLPRDYHSSEKAYPVIYRLDGDLDLFIETAGIIHRLTYREEAIPEMIIVLIENTDRNRDMMPVNTYFFNNEPGAENFKKFIEDELFLHMSSSYRITNERILCGQSLSSIFTLYCYLTSPDLFDSYIASSAGFPDCEAYFINLTHEMLASGKQNLKKLFLTYGANDFLDNEGVIGKQLSNFTHLINSEDSIACKYKVYNDEGHVPFQSLYHGLKFIYE